MLKSVIAFALIAVGSPALGADHPLTERYSSCMDQTGGVTVEMLNCIDEELIYQDARLNEAYRKLGTQLSAPRKKQLVAAQRLWVQFRDANCNFYADPDGGSLAGVLVNTCFLDMTADRASELANMPE